MAGSPLPLHTSTRPINAVAQAWGTADITASVLTIAVVAFALAFAKSTSVTAVLIGHHLRCRNAAVRLRL